MQVRRAALALALALAGVPASALRPAGAPPAVPPALLAPQVSPAPPAPPAPIAEKAPTEPARAPYYFSLAKLLAAEGSYREALAMYQRAVGLDATDPFLRIDYAEFLMQVDRLPQAVEQVRVAQELAPDDLDVLRIAAQIQLSLAEQDPEALAQAQLAFERIRAKTPHDLRSMIALGQLYLSQGQAQRAADVFRELMRYRPRYPAVSSFLVEALVKAGEIAEAEQVLRGAVESNPDSLENRMALADLLRRRGDHRAAVEVLAAAPPEVADSPELRRSLALELFTVGELERALGVIDSLLGVDADYAGGRYLRGLILTALGRNEEAARDLYRLLEEAPGNAEISRALARALEQQGKRAEAIGILEQLRARFERSGQPGEAARVRLQQALLEARSDRWSAVADLLEPPLEPAGEAEPELVEEALILYAEALSHLGQGERAVALLAERRANGMASDDLRGKEAELLFRLERAAEAQAVLGDLSASDEVEKVLVAAEVYQRVDRHAESIPLLQRLLAPAGALVGGARRRWRPFAA